MEISGWGNTLIPVHICDHLLTPCTWWYSYKKSHKPWSSNSIRFLSVLTIHMPTGPVCLSDTELQVYIRIGRKRPPGLWIPETTDKKSQIQVVYVLILRLSHIFGACSSAKTLQCYDPKLQYYKSKSTLLINLHPSLAVNIICPQGAAGQTGHNR